jgi:predicted O-linked N-acetylglucosamine transferase (SPINDLY family)
MNRQQRRATAKAQPSGAAGQFVSAVQHHQAGRIAEAAAAYRSVLAAQPGHADAAFNLGVALRTLGKLDDAIAAYGQAIAINPGYPEAHYNLGNSLMARGQPANAVIAYAQALRIKPDHARASANLALAYSSLGVALMDQGKHDEAAAAFGEALAIKPDSAETYYNLGNALKHHGKLDDAAAAYVQALRVDPNLAEACSNLGNTLLELGRLNEAVAAYTHALRLRPEQAAMHYNLGNALKDQSKLDLAAATYAEAIRLMPDHAGAHANLGIVLMGQGKLDKAAAAYARAIELKPEDADTYSNLMFCLNYDDSQTSAQLFAAHREWGARYGNPALRPSHYANDRTPERRLRVGFVSPDFRTHSVAYFLRPLFEGFDRQAVELFAYADVIRPDAVTAQLVGLTDGWRSTVGVSDDTLAQQICSDGIDILVDLAGHTAHNRLRVFARKPAPVQATWLGYSNTTGLAGIDYRIVDDVTDPPGTADAFASETLLRIPGGFICYGGSEDAPQPSTPPCLKRGFITFGSFNNPAKVSPATFDVWGRLLTRLPDARLLLKGKAFADAATCASFLSRLGERGVAAGRVQLLAWLPDSTAHLRLYEQIDIALDPFPYNGTTTTCEALWMGVPVVTLLGDRHSARVGASLLTQAGLTDWIADSIDDYVEMALALADNPQGLDELRRSLRPRIAASSLCDGDAFAHKMENSFRAMWRRWCERAPSI